MKLVTTARQLRDALRLLRPVVERHNSYPVLGCVLFDGGTITVSDLDIEMTVKIAAQEARGTALIDIFRLIALVSGLPLDGMVTIEADKDKATISFAGGRYDLPYLAPENFPRVNFKPAASLSLDGAGIHKAMRFAAPMICTEETRYYLNGVCFSRDADGQPVVVATDGHRLGVHPYTLNNAALDGKIVPRKTVSILLRLPEPETVEISEGGHRYRWAGMTLTTKLIEGTFPDWKRVTPKEANFSVTLQRSEARQALRRLLALKSGDQSYVTLAFQDERAVMTAKVGNEEAITGREYLPSCVSTEASVGRVVTMNGKYLRGLLDGLSNDHVRLTFIDAGSPIRITTPGDKAFAVLMPARGSHDEFAIQTLREASSAEPQKAAA